MERPRYLQECTVVGIREEVKNNVRALKYIGWCMANGFISPETLKYESIINQIMAEYVCHAEYLRDREANNWGWDRNVVDFSKSDN